MFQFGAAKPLNVFLGQEIELLQKVQSLVKQALADVKLAIEGSIALSPTLNETMLCFSIGKVPPSWLKCSWPSPNLKVRSICIFVCTTACNERSDLVRIASQQISATSQLDFKRSPHRILDARLLQPPGIPDSDETRDISPSSGLGIG